jgi:beta-barrel assembly-enhancing protease
MQLHNARYYSPLHTIGELCTVQLSNSTFTTTLNTTNAIAHQWQANELYTPFTLVNTAYHIHTKADAHNIVAVENTQDITTLNTWLKQNGINYQAKTRKINLVTAYIIATCVGFVAVALLIYFVGLPYVAEKIANQIPFEKEQQLTKESYIATKKEYAVIDSSTTVVTRFFNVIAPHNHLPIDIIVVRNNEFNAYAMPGGHIVLYDSLLRAMTSYEQLAALLMHEYAHIHHRHTAKSMVRNAGAFVLIGALLGDVTGISTTILMGAEGLRSLKYSRSLEHDADVAGLEWCANKGVSNKGYIQLFELLKTQLTITGLENATSFLSTHPELDERIAYAKTRVALVKLSNIELVALFNKLKITPSASK